MWNADDVSIEISAVERDVMIVTIATPAASIELIGIVSIAAGWLRIDAAHVQGLSPGAIGRAGLNAIARKLMEVADVEGVVVQGGTRTTGRARGRRQRPFQFRRRPASDDGG